MPVIGGTRESIRLTNTEPLTLTLPKGYGSADYTVKSVWRFLPPSFSVGQSVGTLTLTCEGHSVSSPLVAADAAEPIESQRQTPWERLLNFFRIE